MNKFSGSYPSLFTIGEPFIVEHAPLQDCGDGWDWCLPEGLHWWGSYPFTEVWSGEWEFIQPLEVHSRSGVVSFTRNLRGRGVRASGICHPTSLLSTSHSWSLEFATVVQMAQVIGADSYATQRRDSGAHAFLPEMVCDPQGDDVLAVLPFGIGSFVGAGRAVFGVDGMTVFFNDEGVVYEPARS